MNCILAVDAGTQSTKASILDRDLNLLETARVTFWKQRGFPIHRK